VVEAVALGRLEAPQLLVAVGTAGPEPHQLYREHQPLMLAVAVVHYLELAVQGVAVTAVQGQREALLTQVAVVVGSGIVILKYKVPSQTVFTFKSSTKWTCPTGVTSVDYLIVGGGGGGGHSTGGGGGGGGYRTGAGLAVNAGTTYAIAVGAGGGGGNASAAATSGGDSSIAGAPITENPSGAGTNTLKAYGGGAGGNNAIGSSNGSNGGSGGGAAGNTAGTE
jgi:hypothetical protein